MTIESAKTYIHRMRDDDEFRRKINDCEDEAANWAFIKTEGYDFSVQEFKQATEEIYVEYGIDPIR